MTADPFETGEWPAVTAVVATRDRLALLREALAAIRAQDYPGPVRTVLVFDQCEPVTDLADDDEHRPVTVVVNTRTPGLAGARNTGVAAATTPLVAFCDDDDTWHPVRLRAQVELLRSEPGAVLVACGIRVRYGDREVDRVLGRTHVGLDDLLRSRLTELHPSTFLIDREQLLAHVGLVDEAIPGSYGEDYEFLLRVARHRDVLSVPEVLVDVRWHQQSYFSERWATIAHALTWLLERYPEFDRSPRGKARVLGQIAFAEAAGGHRSQSVRTSMRTLRTHPLEARAGLALAVAAGVAAPSRVLAALHRRGKGL